MSIEQAQKLLHEISSGVEGGEDTPLTPLVRKAARLAALLDLDEYHGVFDAHLQGIETRKAAQKRLDNHTPKPERGAPDVVGLACIADRTRDDGMVNAHPLHILEELHRRALEARDQLLDADLVLSEYPLRQALQRIRNRLGRFVIEAESLVAAMRVRESAQHPLETRENPMTILSDASKLMQLLAEHEEKPNDPKRGRYNLTQHGVDAIMKGKGKTEASPDRLNDAVNFLEERGYVEVHRGPGTVPFRFNGVQLTVAGRLEYERQLEGAAKTAQAKSPAKPAGTKIFIGHGGSQVWRDLKDFVRDRLHLEHDEFNREPTAGRTTKERLEQMLDDAAFALLVMTGEDERADGATVARQNVIHEIGLFQGRLGFLKAIVLLEDGCEEFSNIAGLTQIHFPKGDISVKFEEIRRVLEREELLPKA